MVKINAEMGLQIVYVRWMSFYTQESFYLTNFSFNSVALVCEWTTPTERPQLVNEASANFCG
jgi:hypothetical protein